MTFIALSMNTTFMMAEKSDLEFQEMIISNQYDEITQEMSSYLEEKNSSNSSSSNSSSSSGSSGSSGSNSSSSSSNNNSTDLDNDPYLQQLKNDEQYYQTKKSTIESQLEALNAELESYKKATTDNIKNECKLTISA